MSKRKADERPPVKEVIKRAKQTAKHNEAEQAAADSQKRAKADKLEESLKIVQADGWQDFTHHKFVNQSPGTYAKPTTHFGRGVPTARVVINTFLHPLLDYIASEVCSLSFSNSSLQDEP